MLTVFPLSTYKGSCWAHHWCAAWSAGVWGQEGPELCGVDKAIFSGISQVGRGPGNGTGKGQGGQRAYWGRAVPGLWLWRELASAEALFPLRQRCSHCTRLGASIPCRSPGCSRLYHFPCATASGSFLSMKTLQLLCPEHSEGAAHLGEESCRLDRGHVRVHGCWGFYALQSAPKSVITCCQSAP